MGREDGYTEKVTALSPKGDMGISVPVQNHPKIAGTKQAFLFDADGFHGAGFGKTHKTKKQQWGSLFLVQGVWDFRLGWGGTRIT